MFKDWINPTYGDDDLRQKLCWYEKVVDYGNIIRQNYLNRKDIIGESFFDGVDNPTINHIGELDEDIKDKLELIVENKTIRIGACNYNSILLPLLIDDVVKVDGWISNSHIYQPKLEFISEMGDDVWFVKRIRENGDVVEYNSNEPWFIRLYDKKTEKFWTRHSWNSYKGFHFDLTKSFGFDVIYKDIKDVYLYREFPNHQSIDGNSLEGWILKVVYDLRNIYDSHPSLSSLKVNPTKNPFMNTILNKGYITNQSLIDLLKN